jgi:colicin import membrane protein
MIGTMQLANVEPQNSQVAELIKNTALPTEKASRIIEGLQSFLSGISSYEQTAATIVVTDPEDARGMKAAREIRLTVRDIRLKCADYVKAERAKVQARMADDKLEDGVLLKSLQIIEQTAKNIEAKLEHQEKFKERWEHDRRVELRQERTAMIEPYRAYLPNYADLADFTEQDFEKIIEHGKVAQRMEQDRIEAERKAEQDRIAQANAEAEKRKDIITKRRTALMPYPFGNGSAYNDAQIYEMSVSAFDTFLQTAKMRHEAHIADQKRKDEEIAQAKAEAEEQRKKQEAQRKKQQEELAEFKRQAAEAKAEAEQIARTAAIQIATTKKDIEGYISIPSQEYDELRHAQMMVQAFEFYRIEQWINYKKAMLYYAQLCDESEAVNG